MARARRRDWKRIAAACERSDLTHEEFAARRGVRVRTLRSWLYDRRRREAASPPRLLPVRVAAVTHASSVEIAHPSGVVVRLGADAGADTIAAIVRALA